MLRRVKDQPVAAVAEAIRHPERANPGTQMPTYAVSLDPARAQMLATWLKALTEREGENSSRSQ